MQLSPTLSRLLLTSSRFAAYEFAPCEHELAPLAAVGCDPVAYARHAWASASELAALADTNPTDGVLALIGLNPACPPALRTKVSETAELARLGPLIGGVTSDLVAHLVDLDARGPRERLEAACALLVDLPDSLPIAPADLDSLMAALH